MIENDIEKVFFSKEELALIVRRLGKQISEDYEGSAVVKKNWTRKIKKCSRKVISGHRQIIQKTHDTAQVSNNSASMPDAVH